MLPDLVESTEIALPITQQRLLLFVGMAEEQIWVMLLCHFRRLLYARNHLRHEQSHSWCVRVIAPMHIDVDYLKVCHLLASYDGRTVFCRGLTCQWPVRRLYPEGIAAPGLHLLYCLDRDRVVNNVDLDTTAVNNAACLVLKYLGDANMHLWVALDSGRAEEVEIPLLVHEVHHLRHF